MECIHLQTMLLWSGEPQLPFTVSSFICNGVHTWIQELLQLKDGVAKVNDIITMSGIVQRKKYAVPWCAHPNYVQQRPREAVLAQNKNWEGHIHGLCTEGAQRRCSADAFPHFQKEHALQKAKLMEGSLNNSLPKSREYLGVSLYVFCEISQPK